MKNKIIIFLGILIFWGCTDNFTEYNTDPRVIQEVDEKKLFAKASSGASYGHLDWFYDNYQSLYQIMQYGVDMSGNTLQQMHNMDPRGGSRYGQFYDGNGNGILFSIRDQIDAKDEANRPLYQNMKAITYFPQIYRAVDMVDAYGAVVYTEGFKGRTENLWSPVYDPARALYDTLYTELNAAITVLKSGLADQQNYGTSDIMYQGDEAKWAKLGNSIIVRMAMRLIELDEATAKQWVTSAVASGVFESRADQYEYHAPLNASAQSRDWFGGNGAVKVMVDFFKETKDPRMFTYVEPLTAWVEGDMEDIETLPAHIDTIGDPLYMYQGIPSATNEPSLAQYTTALKSKTDKNQSYVPVSNFNRRFQHNRYQSGFYSGVEVGQTMEHKLTYSELCFSFAELTERFGMSIKGKTAEEWYNAGIEATILDQYQRATLHNVPEFDDAITAMYGSTDMTLLEKIAMYLQQTKVAYTGSMEEKLEKIYVQWYLSYYTSPRDGWYLARRTGYPKFESSVYPREYATVDKADVKFRRRYYLPKPNEFNWENWGQAHTDQGYTPELQDNETLHDERTPFDVSSNDFGKGLK